MFFRKIIAIEAKMTELAEINIEVQEDWRNTPLRLLTNQNNTMQLQNDTTTGSMTNTQLSLITRLKKELETIQSERTKRPVFKAMLSHLFPTLTGLVYTANLVQGVLYGLNENFSIPSTTQDPAYTQLAQESHLWGFVSNVLGTVAILGCLLIREFHSENTAFIRKEIQMSYQKLIPPFLMASATNLAIEISLMARTEYKVHDDFLNDPKRLALVMTVVNVVALLSATIGILLNHLKHESSFLLFMPLRYQEGVELSKKIFKDLNEVSQNSAEEQDVKKFIKKLTTVSKEVLPNLLEAYLKGLNVSIGKEDYTFPQTQGVIQDSPDEKYIITLASPAREEPKDPSSTRNHPTTFSVRGD